MKEELLYYVWKYGLFDNHLTSNFNQHVRIKNPGILNQYSGPDFSNSQVQIDDQLWVGNVEIHVKSSDWLKHGHDGDKSYSSVILHVVYDHDIEIDSLNFRKIPTVELKGKVRSSVLERFEIISSRNEIPCEPLNHSISRTSKIAWYDRLLVERLERKTTDLKQILDNNTGDWEQSYLIWLCRGFGLKANSGPFEMLGTCINQRILLNSENHESLLFGIAGILPEYANEPYVYELQQSWKFQCKKWKLKSLPKHLWKKGGLRPANHPEIRLAQLAGLLEKHKSNLLGSILDANSYHDLVQYLEIELSEFWKGHQSFVHRRSSKQGSLTRSMKDLLIINTIVPFWFLYGTVQGEEHFKENALAVLQEIKPEKNRVVDKMRRANQICESAFDSQALIQLYNKYCSAKKCLFCNFGKEILLK